MDAVPLLAAVAMVKLGVESPSLVSVNVRVPVMAEVSSAAEPVVSPEKEPASSTWLTVTLTVAVSVTPPEVTV